MSLTVPQEALLKTLAVMTRADSNIKKIEVEAVQEIMKEEFGLSISSAQVHVAANAEFIEDREINKYLKSVLKQLDLSDKKTIARNLKKVALADGHVGTDEIKMFNAVAETLKLTAADLVQL